jgi:hypothetical protein
MPVVDGIDIIVSTKFYLSQTKSFVLTRLRMFLWRNENCGNLNSRLEVAGEVWQEQQKTWSVIYLITALPQSRNFETISKLWDFHRLRKQHVS